MSAVSLYGRLYKYRERRDRGSLEDFLTEALADFLLGLPSIECATFVGQLFVPEGLKSEWGNLTAAQPKFQIDTQCWIDRFSRLDLLISVDHHPALVIENKVAAKEDGQLVRYGKWLASVEKKWPGAICFLTHLASPPDDFLSQGKAKYLAEPKVLSWSQVAAALQQLSKKGSTVSAAKAADLALFLEENGMSAEFADLEDFAAGLVYLRSNKKLERTFETIHGFLASSDPIFLCESKYEYSLWFDSGSNLIEGFKYINVTFEEAFVAFGISMKPALNLKATTAPEADSVYIALGSDKGSEFRRIEKSAQAYSRWQSIPEHGCVAIFRPLSEFLIAPQEFSSRMIEWIQTSLPEVKAIIAGA